MNVVFAPRIPWWAVCCRASGCRRLCVRFSRRSAPETYRSLKQKQSLGDYIRVFHNERDPATLPRVTCGEMRVRTMRLLILVPIIHTEADLGSLSESVRRSHIERTGTEQWDRRRVAVADLWRTIQSQIESLHLDYVATSPLPGWPAGLRT